MSEDIPICSKCKALMEFFNRFEKTSVDGQLFIYEEYRCRPCQNKIILDLGSGSMRFDAGDVYASSQTIQQ